MASDFAQTNFQARNGPGLEAAAYLFDKDHVNNMQAGEPSSRESGAKIRCQVCGLAFATELEKQKHLELEHMKNKKPAGVR